MVWDGEDQFPGAGIHPRGCELGLHLHPCREEPKKGLYKPLALSHLHHLVLLYPWGEMGLQHGKPLRPGTQGC